MSVTSIGTASEANGDGATSTRVERVAEPTGPGAYADLRVAPLAPGRRPSRLAPVAIGLVPALSVALVAPTALLPWACAAGWAAAAGVRAVAARRRVAGPGRLPVDVRTGVVLACLLAFAGVAGVPATQVRWGIAVTAAGAVAAALARAAQPRRTARRRVVLVGTRQDIESYAGTVRGSDEVLVVGCHIVNAAARALPLSVEVPVATSVDSIDVLVSGVGADAVLVLPGRDTDADLVRQLSWALEHQPVTLGVVAPVSSVSAHRLRTTELAGSTVLELGAAGPSALEVRVKGLVDRVGAALLLVVVSPLLVLMVAAVRLDSRGGGFFVQTRVGKDGTDFRMFKMRTMYADAEAMKQALLEDNDSDGVLFKIRRDPRVTRVGYWLRRFSFDELPQVLNVLLGQMSLVGPRPALPSEVASYDAVARRRLVVKPGITGLWQVSGRSDLLWDESLRLDLYYADNWRLLGDVAIAARTVGAVTSARGAY